MKKRQKPGLLLLGLILIGVLSITLNYSGLLKTQVLQTPERIQELKLIRHETNPVQFDIFYESLKSDRPDSVSITMVNALLDQGGRFQSSAAIIQSVVLSTGQQQITSTANSQTLSITSLTPLPTTKLGTIFTNIPLQEYVSLEYDITISGKRTTIIERPVPVDFPIGYQVFQNPTGEPMYISVPGYHTLLAPLEKVYVKYPSIQHGAVLLPNTLTTLQELSELNQSSLINQTLNLPVPELIVEQNQLILPALPAKDYNTLIIRYRKDSDEWSGKSFLLSASKDVTLPIPVSDLLDFYTEVEYSFAYLSDAMPTLNLDFPYNSLLLTGQNPVFYRTQYVSLLNELVQNRNGLVVDLTITTPEDPNAISIGFLSRNPIFSLAEALPYLSQQLPVAIFDAGSVSFQSVMSNPQQLPTFNLLGKNNQVWSKQTIRTDLEFLSTAFESIALQPDDQQIPELEIVDESNGDRLLCFAKTEQGSFSLPTIRQDVIFSSNCLQSAKRAGLKSGILYPIAYRAKTQSLEALKHFRFDERIGELFPSVQNYDPYEKTLTLGAGFEDVPVKIVSSSTPDFRNFSTLAMENLEDSQFAIPLLPGCETFCYIKAVAVVREDADVLLGYPAETLLFSPIPEPLLQLCFTNQQKVSELYEPADLKFQIQVPNEDDIDLSYKSDSGCYEIGFGELEDRELNLEASLLEASSSSSASSSDTNPTNPTNPNDPNPPSDTATDSDSGDSDESGESDESEDSENSDNSDNSSTPPTNPTPPTSPSAFLPSAYAQTNSSEHTLKDLVSDSPDLPTNTLIIHTNGLSNSHIDIPPQRHYASLSFAAEQQVVLEELVFEHAHLNSTEQLVTDPVLHTSYQISQWGNTSTFFSSNRGNVMIHRFGDSPYFFERFSTPAPINESLLFPGGGHLLEIPHTIRLIPPEQIILLASLEGTNKAQVPLEIPERSKVTMFLDNVFRPNIEQELLLEDGILYDAQSGLMTLENPTGLITIPVQLTVNKVTDSSIYANTTPETKVPSQINIASIRSDVVFEINQPQDIPRSTLREPHKLPRGAVGFQYSEKVPLFAIENSRAFEIIDSRFLTSTCREIFSFDPATRMITGTVPTSSKLEGCYMELLVRYLIRNSFSEMEITTPLTYQIPLLTNDDLENISAEVIRVPLTIDGQEVNEIISIKEPVEELVETTPQFVSKDNAESLISSIGELLIVFDEANQQFVISGLTTELFQTTSRYLRAIQQQTGRLVLFELQMIPVQQEELILPITQSFPNLINVPQILRDEGFSEEEIATLRIAADTLPTQVEVSDTGVVNIFGLPELNDQVFSALIDKAKTTPSAFEEFEERLTDIATDEPPQTLRINLRLQVNEAPSVTVEAVIFGTSKNVTIDLRRFAPNSSSFITGQLPEFLTRSGNTLTGLTPAEDQQVNLLVQDFSTVRNIIVPLIIGEIPLEGATNETENTGEAENESTDTPEDQINRDLANADKGASNTSTDCFPDIALQVLEYREAICVAEQFNIISGSNGFFNPDNNINRAEVSKILVTGPLVILGLLTEAEANQLNNAFSEQNFSDVPRTAWFYGFVETALVTGIVDGYPNGTFQPGNALNRAEAAKVIVNTMLQLSPETFGPSESLAANTIPGDQWFAPYVRILNMNGGDLPDPTDSDALGLPISRAEFVYNLLIILDSKASQISVGL
jgi:hypothetical protein